MMGKLHEVLAAEKTPNAAFNTLFEETKKKFGNTATYFSGHSKSLKMLEENPANKAVEGAARDDKPVTTNVHDTLEYLFEIFGRAEDLQFQKNATNQIAKGTVEYRGKALLVDMPVDQLLGLEARLAKVKDLYLTIPTLDSSKAWVPSTQQDHVWELKSPEETTKTEKTEVPVILAPATDKHPAQVKTATKDIVVGTYTTMLRSGTVTAQQKADAIKVVDELIVEVKRARMRANETEVVKGSVSDALLPVLMEAFK